MNHGRMEAKRNEPLAEPPSADDRYPAFADLGQEDGYLPPKDNQSWRELESLRGVVPYESENDDADLPASADFEQEQEFSPEPDSGGPGLKGVMFAFCAVAIIGLAAVEFTAPGLLTTSFWRAQWAATNSAANPPPAPAVAAHAPVPVPAPLAARAPSPPPPVRGPDLNSAPALMAPVATPPVATPPPVVTPPAAAVPAKPAVPPENQTRDANTAPAAHAIPEPAPKPGPRKVLRAAGRGDVGDHDTGGFYAMVAGPGGTLEYRYFPSKPSR